MAAEYKLSGDVKAALVVASLLTLIGLGIGSAPLGFGLGIIVLLLVVYCMTKVPARLTMLTLLFFVLILPNPAEGTSTNWDPPGSTFGAILLNHLNTVDREFTLLSSVAVSGMDILFAILALILISRKASRSKLELLGKVPTPKPMVRLAQLSLLTILVTWIGGLLRGGEFGMSLWQVNSVIYVPIVFLLFQASLRGPADHPAIGRIVLAAATYKCLLAYYIVHAFVMPMDPDTGSTRPVYGTSHNDSMLFALAFVIILAQLVENSGKKATRAALVFLPILVAGTMANNRRLAWVQVGLVFVTVYIVSRPTPFKRLIRRTVLAILPVAVVYLALGWNVQYSTVFKPVKMIRSVVDAKSDGSSEWRELENYDLIMTYRDHSLFGVGFGNPYEEIVVLPKVNYSLERFAPHNSLLGVWCFTGVVGFAGLTLLWISGVYFAMRAYYHTTDRTHRVAALVSFAAVLVYMLQSWGDLGLASTNGAFIMGCALACAGKLAAANGQWGTPTKAPAPSKSASVQA